LRIALVVTGGIDRSGRERVVPSLLWLIEQLARRHDVHVFVLHYYREACDYPLRGATIHDLGRVEGPPGLRLFRIQRRLAAAIDALAKTGRVDVLHAYWAMPAGAAAADVGRRTGIPVVATFDSGELVALGDIDYGLQRRWLDRRTVAGVMQRAARVTVTTKHMMQMAAVIAPATRIDVVPIGINLAEFPPSPRPEGPPWRLLRVASLNRVKDYPTLLRGLARLTAVLPGVHLDVVGEDTLAGAVQQLARALGVEAHVTFHGFQPTDALARFYQRAHLHVVSSRHEAAGVVVLEAAASGVPTVGTRVGFLADWADENAERAVAVPVGDDAALAQAVFGLVNDLPRRERMAANAREWAAAHDAEWTARQFEKIYSEVIAIANSVSHERHESTKDTK
jgi:glycosyltransferase involved in cell wall biosynthesis